MHVHTHTQVYQWHEDYSVKYRTDFVHGGLVTENDYTYSKIWSYTFENSDNFVKPTTCALTRNHGELPFLSFSIPGAYFWHINCVTARMRPCFCTTNDEI